MKESTFFLYELFRRNEGKIEKSNSVPVLFEDDFYNSRPEIIWEIIRAGNEEEINRIISDHCNINLLRAFSHLRGNLFSWLDVKPEDEILVIGEDIYWCAAFLAKRINRITLVTHNIYHLLIIAEKLRETGIRLIYSGKDSYTGILNGLLSDNVYDYAFFSDFVRCKKNDNSLLQIISEIKQRLSDRGKLVFATENPLGLKLWSGCADTLTGGLWSGIEGYAHENDGYLTIKAIKELISESGFKNGEILYPYPDCWFPVSIYSDSHLPEVGELKKNAFSWEKRVHLFNEVLVWNNIISNDAFRLFSNGYIAVLSDAAEPEIKKIYSKFSNDRDESFSIRTDLFSDKNGVFHVEKRALTRAGSEHISKLPAIEKKLSEIYSGTDIEIQKIYSCKGGKGVIKEEIKGIGEIVELEYIEGNSMSSVLKEFIEKDLEEDFVNLFSDFADILVSKADVDFSTSEQFELFFGPVDVPVGLKCCRITDIDLIVSNVIIRNGKYGIIDYEWTFDFPIPVDFVIFRSIIDLFTGPRGEANHNLYYRTILLDKYGIDDDLFDLFSQMENNFQDFICSKHVPLRNMLIAESINGSVIQPEVFVDFGKGFSNKNKYRTPFKIFDKDTYRFSLGIMPGLNAIRLDPTDHPCIVSILDIICVGTDNYRPQYLTNGISIGNGVIIYNTNDPQIVVYDIRYGTERIEIEIVITEISSGVSQAIADKCSINQ